MRRLATFRRRLGWAGQIALVIGVMSLIVIAGAADLHFHGLGWRILYQITGEEAPTSQLYGALQWAGNLTRPLPAVQPLTIATTQTDVNYNGVNTFLEDEVEPAKREQQLALIKAAGFGWIRQQFRWDDLEISGRGDFTDRRNGAAVDAWAKYDSIVELAGKAQVNIMARLGSPPAWSQAPNNKFPGYAPPADNADFVNYARAVASRYQGRITVYQVWNEPNLYPEWGKAAPDPEAYTALLCQTYRALKAVDPKITVIMGALGPSIGISERNLTDFIYLQRMYDAGAGQCFDVLSVQGYGLRSGPTDQRMRALNININHVLYLRELMVNNRDAAKPVWIAEMAWNPVPEDPTIQNKELYGRVDDDQAAAYTVAAYQRVRAEWPWVQGVFYWFFKRAGDSEKNQSWYYFRMLDPDFNERPVYRAFKDYATKAR